MTMQEIERFLRGDDIYCTIMAYVVREPGATVARVVPNVFGADRAVPFELRDDSWPTSIDLTEFTISSMPVHFADNVSAVLRSLQDERPALCWFMFDGAFDVAVNCYAVHAPSLDQPALALAEEERRGAAWTKLRSRLAAEFYGKYPSLRAVE
jgi:hypothetical protein